MLARMTNVEIHHGNFSRAVDIFSEMKDRFNDEPGFMDLMVMSDHASHKIISISFWEDEQSLADGEREVFDTMLGELMQLASGPPKRETLSVNIPVEAMQEIAGWI